MNILKASLIFAMLLPAIKSHAASEYRITPAAPGRAFTVDFIDGRQAQILSAEYPIARQNFGLQLTETNCPVQAQESVRCDLKIPFRLQQLGLVWTKFEGKPQRLFQPVRYKGNSADPDEAGFNIFESKIDVAADNYSYKKNSVPQAEKWILTCAKSQFLDSLLDSQKKINLLEMSGEQNTENPETKINENRSPINIDDIVLSPVSEGYEIFSMGNSIGILAASQNVHMVFANPRGGHCEMNFSSDNSQLVSLVQNLSENEWMSDRMKIPNWRGLMQNDFISLLGLSGALE